MIFRRSAWFYLSNLQIDTSIHLFIKNYKYLRIEFIFSALLLYGITYETFIFRTFVC